MKNIEYRVSECVRGKCRFLKTAKFFFGEYLEGFFPCALGYKIEVFHVYIFARIVRLTMRMIGTCLLVVKRKNKCGKRRDCGKE
jgi:hypothetical protein